VTIRNLQLCYQLVVCWCRWCAHDVTARLAVFRARVLFVVPSREMSSQVGLRQLASCSQLGSECESEPGYTIPFFGW
jgi:hypothetical protein